MAEQVSLWKWELFVAMKSSALLWDSDLGESLCKKSCLILLFYFCYLFSGFSWWNAQWTREDFLNESEVSVCSDLWMKFSRESFISAKMIFLLDCEVLTHQSHCEFWQKPWPFHCFVCLYLLPLRVLYHYEQLCVSGVCVLFCTSEVQCCTSLVQNRTHLAQKWSFQGTAGLWLNIRKLRIRWPDISVCPGRSRFLSCIYRVPTDIC